MSSFIGRGEVITERIVKRLFLNTETHEQVPIKKLILDEDFIEYGEEFSKHKCDLVIRVLDHKRNEQILVIEVNYKHGEKAAKKWSQTFAPDIKRAGNIPVTIDDYDCKTLFKQNSRKEQQANLG